MLALRRMGDPEDMEDERDREYLFNGGDTGPRFVAFLLAGSAAFFPVPFSDSLTGLLLRLIERETLCFF